MAFRHCPQESLLVLVSQSDFHGSNSFICRVARSAMRGSRLLVGPPGVVRFEGKQLQEIWWWFSLFYPSLSLSFSLSPSNTFSSSRKNGKSCNTHYLNQRWRLRKTGPFGASIFDTVWMETVIPPTFKSLSLWALEMLSGLLHELCNTNIHKWACESRWWRVVKGA